METGGKTRQLVPEGGNLPVSGAHDMAVTVSDIPRSQACEADDAPEGMVCNYSACVILVILIIRCSRERVDFHFIRR
jgi:hypothetical protein